MNTVSPWSEFKRRLVEKVLFRSLKMAGREQGLEPWLVPLRSAVPDLSEQYSCFKVQGEYLEMNVRLLHAFQMSLVSEAIRDFSSPTIVDIGDSSGTHLRYIQAIFGQRHSVRTLSVNLDKSAVERVRARGMEAVCARAEDLAAYDVNADILMSFEMLEHLPDPSGFMHALSMRTSARYFIVTVPLVRQSRIGLQYIREGRKEGVCAENTHIFELSPEDWKLLACHSGWGVVREKEYWQYPSRGIWSLVKPLWRKYDYEGFYGLILRKDHTYSACYKDR